jgi:ribonuclease-3 family protein
MGITTVAGLHRQTVARVNAAAQARAAEKIALFLSDAERDIFKRGRNTHMHAAPKNADTAQYHAATGLKRCSGGCICAAKTAVSKSFSK